jgi:hypothetical protein
MNEWNHNLYINGPADVVDEIVNPDPYYASDRAEYLGTDTSGRKTIKHRFLTKGFAPGFKALEALVEQYQGQEVCFYLLAYFCGCYWLDNDPDPFTYSYYFAEAYTAIPKGVTSVFLPEQGVTEYHGGIIVQRNRNKMLHDDDRVTEVLFLDWSRNTVVCKVVPEPELFLQFYGDGGEDVYLDPVRGLVIPVPLEA